MSRYIDADALKKEVDNFPNCYNGWSDTYDKAFIIGAIEEQPSIDIVRCKECIFADLDEEAEMYRCGSVSFPHWNRGEHFCADGEREGE